MFETFELSSYDESIDGQINTLDMPEEKASLRNVRLRKNKCGIQQLANNEFNKTLKNILIPRVSGTDGNKKVREYIMSRMSGLGWTVTQDSFEEQTPYGMKPFSNIIATNNDKVCKRIVIACHYDSKYFSNIKFVGATDSAVPCAILIHLATVLKNNLAKHQTSNADPTLQFLFFDGEEAFQYWTEKDSLYGARHLANEWHKTKLKDSERAMSGCQLDNQLNRINVLILLDLIGASNMKFNNYFQDTSHLYSKLMNIEKKYNNKNQLFVSNSIHYSGIDDDHKPFLQRNVPILHLISNPFPVVWHQKTDNSKNLDFRAINLFLNIFYDFLKEILNL